ncbi:hypothetical protein FD724_06835 [Nostoc sp. C057]|uniref:hypothetical protein n=1 Tax=Nostoc sp. C057 TaxID=2576903 RepID=UPI001C4C569F|nr:hypothetical protein [Nostoc sp. C057]QLE47854.1 hypothetical protein FD724_06835 [Nostoc sp. C057]
MQADDDEVDDKAVLKHLSKLQANQRTAIVEKFFSNNSIQDIAKRQKATPEKSRLILTWDWSSYVYRCHKKNYEFN